MFCCAGPAWAQSQATIDIEVIAGEDGFPRRIRGRITYENPPSSCYYLPYNDPEYGEYNSLENRLEIQQDPFRQVTKKPGYSKVKSVPGTPILFESQQEVFAFESLIPRVPDASDDLWIFEGFYPQVLTHCPEGNVSPARFPLSTGNEFAVNLQIPNGWMYAGIGDRPDHFQFYGTEFGFALFRHANVTQMEVGDIKVKVIYRSPDFIKLLPTIKRGLQRLPDWFGPFPFDNIAIVESDRLEKNSIPGLVTINKPRQPTLQSIQLDWLNWSHWVSFNLLSHQWLGAQIKGSNPDDDWLPRGLIEFTTLRTLEEFTTRFNIFNSVETGISLIEFNYREIQDLGATVLYLIEPNTTLTDNELRSARAFDKQHSMTSLRQAVAMRYLESYFGTERMQKILRNFIRGNRRRNFTPKLFYDFVADGHPEIAAVLRVWWTQPGWPDFSVKKLESKRTGNIWSTEVEVGQKGELKLPTTATFTDQDGQQVTVPVVKKGNRYIASAELENQVDEVEIDAERSVYDSNRYNNTTRWPSLRFFPGSARGVPDDGYTVIWAPYPFRRPGQPWSLALNAGLFRYINSSTNITLESELGPQQRTAFGVSQSYNFPSWLLAGQMAAQQDIFGSRVIFNSLSYGPIFDYGPRLNVIGTVRHRQVVGKSKSGHQTIAGSAVLANRGRIRFYGFRLLGEYESAPKTTSRRFQYERRIGIAELLASIPGYFDYKFRFFRGEYTFNGDVPDELFFYPEDLKMARLRLDVSDLERTAKIYSIGNDLFLPFSLRFGSGSFLLNRRLRWRAFYDYGRSLDLQEEYRAAGGGLHIPLGGDVVGVGTLSLTRFTLLVVGYSYANGEVSNRPRLLFTFGADL